jgi:hypothetical protein
LQGSSCALYARGSRRHLRWLAHPWLEPVPPSGVGRWFGVIRLGVNTGQLFCRDAIALITLPRGGGRRLVEAPKERKALARGERAAKGGEVNPWSMERREEPRKGRKNTVYFWS